jgi:hypothetical protein
MSDEESDSEQRRDKLLLRLLKMPPQTRAQLKAERAKGKRVEARGKRVRARKREPSA